MPQCRHSNKKFVRFEGLKKHLKQACPVLHQVSTAAPDDTTTAISGCTTELEVVSRSTRRAISEGPKLPLAQLRNPDNVCHAHASLQVFYWTGVLTGRSSACYGRAQAGMPVLATAGSHYLPACMHLQAIFRGWPALHGQQDVLEFMQHVVEVTQPSVYEGVWEARLTNPHTVSETGYLRCPLVNHFQARTCKPRYTLRTGSTLRMPWLHTRARSCCNCAAMLAPPKSDKPCAWRQVKAFSFRCSLSVSKMR